MKESLTAVVIGATGFIGELLVNELIGDPQFTKVRLLVRRPIELSHPKSEIAIVDFNNQKDFAQKLDNADCLFCCIGTTQKQVKGDKDAYRKIDYDIPLHAAQFAKQAGFDCFLLVSAIGANARSGNFYLKLKGETEDAVAAVRIHSLHIFQPSMLLGKRKEFRLGEVIGQKLIKTFSFALSGNLKKYRGIPGITVAKAMVAAAKQNLPGKHIYAYDDMLMLADHQT